MLILIITGGIFFIGHSTKSPLPKDINDQVNFKVIYPSSHAAQIQPSSYNYHQQQKVLNFKVNYAGSPIVFSQQPAPRNIGLDTQSYLPALGIHPYAQFDTALGQVALTKFYQSGNLKLFSQSAVLVSQDTLLIATSSKSLTNEQWKSLFDSLKITK
jgi:hypothetical protein